MIGNPKKKVSKVAFGTGAITNNQIMYQMGADVLILTDDGTILWRVGQWAEDTGIPIMIVNHATAEEPGISTLTAYLQKQFPDIYFEYIKRGAQYWTVK